MPATIFSSRQSLTGSPRLPDEFYVTTEFGFGLVLTIGAFALYFWTRRNEVSAPVKLEQFKIAS
jgi:hypothetical protein